MIKRPIRAIKDGWINWFLYDRKDIVCKAVGVGEYVLFDLFERTAFECGAIAVYICNDWSILAIFSDMPKARSTSI